MISKEAPSKQAEINVLIILIISKEILLHQCYFNPFSSMLVNSVITQAFDEECLLSTQNITWRCFPYSSKIGKEDGIIEYII